jgi:hypothetical protein
VRAAETTRAAPFARIVLWTLYLPTSSGGRFPEPICDGRFQHCAEVRADGGLLRQSSFQRAQRNAVAVAERLSLRPTRATGVTFLNVGEVERILRGYFHRHDDQPRAAHRIATALKQGLIVCWTYARGRFRAPPAWGARYSAGQLKRQLAKLNARPKSPLTAGFIAFFSARPCRSCASSAARPAGWRTGFPNGRLLDGRPRILGRSASMRRAHRDAIDAQATSGGHTIASGPEKSGERPNRRRRSSGARPQWRVREKCACAKASF